jgi:molybdopterin-guanine dinucleotide biosynthesis protein MobB
MNITKSPPILCFVGLSGCGKTYLTSQVIESLTLRGLKIGALKHASHGFHLDKPGKDSHRFRSAGAYAIGIASDTEQAVITSTETPATLAQLADAMPAGLDLILCEGFAAHDAMKIGVHRDCAPLPTGVDGLVAVVGCGAPYPDLPTFEADELDAICELVLQCAGINLDLAREAS